MKTAAYRKYMALLSGKDRSPDRFRELSAEYYKNAYNWALRYMDTEQDAQDLVQETFLSAHLYFGTLKKSAKFKGWLFSIMRNIYLKKIRQATRLKTVSIEDNPGYLTELERVSQSMDTEHIIEKKLEAGQLHRIIRQLAEKYKSPLMLYFMEDFSYRDIANTLDIPVGTVMSRLSRGKQMLKKEILKQSSQRGLDTTAIDLTSIQGN